VGDDDPTPLVTAKFGRGVGFDPLKKVQNPNLSLNPYELMSDIIQTHLQKLFYNGLSANCHSGTSAVLNYFQAVF